MSEETQEKDSDETTSSPREPTLTEALIPVVALIFFLANTLFTFTYSFGDAGAEAVGGWNVLGFHIGHRGGDPHLSLILAAAVAAGLGLRLGHSWKSIETGMVEGIKVGMSAILILIVIGALIGTWIASGIVPMLIVCGLKALSPTFFLAATCLVCAIVSLSTGSSWTTAGTVGVALIGVGEALGVPLGMAAGAVVSGAYFGDKVSPLSDTTNLAPAVAGSELFEHIRHMAYTTVPALIISILLYLALGFFVVPGEGDTSNVALYQETIAGAFNLNPLLLLPPLLVIGMVIYRIPALPALLGGAVLGALFAVIFQGAGWGEILTAVHSGYSPDTGVAAVDELLENGGMLNMMTTVALILCALSFGGVMEKTRMLAVIANAILSLAKSTGSLILATVATCVGMNVIAPDQYLSIVVPGRMYREAYEQRGLHAKNLSRTLEDAGTLTSPLVPWNTCGAFMTGALAVNPITFLPFAFLNLLTPMIAILYGYTGWKIERIKPAE
jgi:Na+:H+ antiporter, NhaC family